MQKMQVAENGSEFPAGREMIETHFQRLAYTTFFEICISLSAIFVEVNVLTHGID